MVRIERDSQPSTNACIQRRLVGPGRACSRWRRRLGATVRLGASAVLAEIVTSSSATESGTIGSNEEAWTDMFTESSATTAASQRRRRPVALPGGDASSVLSGVIVEIVAPNDVAADGHAGWQQPSNVHRRVDRHT
jgi:hypothetical protein